MSAAGAVAVDTAIKVGNKIADMAQNYRSQKRAFQFQKEMYEQQIADQVKYNDPAYLVGRMKASGLNPYLGSGAGAEFAGNVGSSTPSASAPSGSSPINTNVTDAYFRDKLIDAQVRNLNADTEEKLANAGLNSAKKIWQDIENEWANSKNDAELKKLQGEAAKMAAETAFTEASMKKLDAEIDELVSRIGLQGAQKAYFTAQAKTAYIYAELAKQETKLHAVQTKLNAVGITLDARGLQIEAQKVKVQAGQLELNGKMFDFDKEMREAGLNLEQSRFMKDVVFSAIDVIQNYQQMGLQAATAKKK